MNPQIQARHDRIDQLFEEFFAAGPISEEECKRHLNGITTEMIVVVALAALQRGEP